MKVRPAKTSDAARCAQISPVRTAEELRKLLGQEDTQWLVLEDGGDVVGVGILHYWAWNQMAWIWDLTVDEGQRGKGCGRTLLKGMLRAAKKAGAATAQRQKAEALLKSIADSIHDDWTAYRSGGERFPADGFDLMDPEKAAAIGRLNSIRRAVADQILALQAALRRRQ